jgi:glycosyltransferase involved in cell wall biosynthesis
MHQSNLSIVTRTNIQGGVVVINQCDVDRIEEQEILSSTGKRCRVMFISSRERGLSKSRNMAINYSTADICLVCDDDEILDDDYEEKIISAFRENQDYEVLAFQVKYGNKKYPVNAKDIGYLSALKVSSVQIAFRRNSIIDKGIQFDVTVGSGVSKAGGEENIFLYDCLRKKLRIRYVPVEIGKIIEGPSQWFHGYTREYFYDRGIMTRKLMGGWSLLYAIYFLVLKINRYRKDISPICAAKYLFKGIFKI